MLDNITMARVYNSIPRKCENFTPGQFSDYRSVSMIKSGNFPQWQYNGVAEFTQIVLWCEQNLGDNFIWNFETFYFKQEKHKILFLLKWA